MVEPMDIDQEGVSGQATPAESYTESSLRREDTPESTEVWISTILPCYDSLLIL
jgi:hypothetical protein